jgi:hypothetical protein
MKKINMKLGRIMNCVLNKTQIIFRRIILTLQYQKILLKKSSSIWEFMKLRIKMIKSRYEINQNLFDIIKAALYFNPCIKKTLYKPFLYDISNFSKYKNDKGEL